ncbi:hypothetical protein M231_04205 [Tremella mesenterica]|uniref:Calpain catalytic domain-containing protein n=1 Tax=Tremella mesenterica TaxID=5217 RepID=A0A4Q1BLP6_TREME|nr:hypothetical protein M231_04205 [Tremella mesenterica]
MLPRWRLRCVYFLTGVSQVLSMTPPAASATVDFTLPPGSKFTNTTLWQGVPSVYDVRQVSVLDCWLPAVTLSVLFASPSFVQSLYFYTNGTSLYTLSSPSPAAPEVYVKVFNPTTLSPVFELVSIANESTTEDVPNGVWWHSALTQAIQLLGTQMSIPGIASDGSIISMEGNSEIALSVYTGKKTVMALTKGMTSDDFFQMLSHAPNSPIVLATVDTPTVTVPPVGNNHAYAVMNTTDWGGGRNVTCRNPWGSWVNFRLEDIMVNVWGVAHLSEYESLEPGGSG